jgi:AraC-like DNA-binding protein
MPVTGTIAFSDPGDYQTSFRGATINLVFIGPGTFGARLTSVCLPHLRLFSVQESLPRIAYVSLPPRWVTFAFPTSFKPPPIWSGIEMKPQDLMFHSVGERMHQRTSGACKWGVISIDPEVFARFSKALIGSEVLPPRVSRILRPSRTDALKLQHQHTSVCHLAETNPRTVSHQEVARAIESDIIGALVNCLTADVVQNDTALRRRHAAIMDQFENALATNVAKQLTIPELCRTIGVAERSLRMCCLNALGTSPSQYIRLRRLNLVHVALQHADPATARISDIAARYGFSEFGRLSVFYRTIFGETPSASLRRPRPKIHDLQLARSV